MESLINELSAWEVLHHASQFFCAVLLVAIIVDATIVGLLREALLYVVASFVLGVVLIEISLWLPLPDAILIWLCVTSTYYGSIRLNRKTTVDPRSPWSLATSFSILWTIHAIATGLVVVLIAYFHPNYIPLPIFGRHRIVERFVEWLVVLFAAAVVGWFFHRHPRYYPRGLLVVAVIAAITVAFYNFEGTETWRFYWALFE